MSKTALFFTFVFALVIILSATLTSQAQADLIESTNPIDIEQIKETIQAYFKARYYSLSSLQSEDFSELVDESLEGKSFLRSEADKLDIEIYRAELYRFRYLQYEYFLDFQEIVVDDHLQTASVSISENHDVVFEVSEPIVSSMRNRHHTIKLRKVDGTWKIVSDSYEDNLWKVINTTQQSKAELIRLINETYTSTYKVRQEVDQGMIVQQTALPLDTGIYPYNREGAIDYAFEWAFGRNLKYHPFDGEGGDCTNFVSQAMYEGGDAIMAYSPYWPRPDIGAPGWYYAGYFDRAAAWVDKVIESTYRSP